MYISFTKLMISYIKTLTRRDICKLIKVRKTRKISYTLILEHVKELLKVFVEFCGEMFRS